MRGEKHRERERDAQRKKTTTFNTFKVQTCELDTPGETVTSLALATSSRVESTVRQFCTDASKEESRLVGILTVLSRSTGGLSRNRCVCCLLSRSDSPALDRRGRERGERDREGEKE